MGNSVRGQREGGTAETNRQGQKDSIRSRGRYTLVSTKLNIPPVNARMLQRTHLVERLSAGKGCRLMVIHGVAGSGKTSLACQWINGDGIRAAWYSLDKSDNDSDTFFRYLLTALSQADTVFKSAMSRWLQSQKKLSAKEVTPFIVNCLNYLPGDLYLVLDDYQQITSKRIHHALSFLLDYLPHNLHLVIISRCSPPFSLVQFKVRNQTVEISAEDLRFTEEETERYFTDIVPLKLSPKEAHELARYTEGWVAALQLLGLSLRGKETLDGLNNIFNRTFHETADYLIDQVIDVQPKKVKDFIYVTALLERFNVSLCRELTDCPDVPPILDHVYRNNLFLVPLDSERTWFRYHHLFSKAIKQRVMASSPDRLREIHRRAAIWFARNNYLEDAFRHAFASEDFEFVADFLEDHLFLMYESHEIASGLKWLAKLPREVFIARALLRLYECGFKIDSLQLQDIEMTLTDVTSHRAKLFERYDGFKRRLCEDLLTYFQQVLPYYVDLDSANADEVNEAIRRASPDNKFYYSFIKNMVTYTWRHLFHEGLPSASHALREALATISSSDSVWARMTWFRSMAYMERWQGHLHRTEAVLRDGFQFLEWKGLSDAPVRFLLYLPMAWVFYFRNDLEKVLEYAKVALSYAERVTDVIDIVEASALLSYAHESRGEWEETDKYVQKMHSVAKAVGKPEIIALVNALHAHVSMAKGDLRWVEQWAHRRKLTMDEPFCFHFVFECLAQGELYYRQRRYADAAAMLETLRNRCLKRNIIEPALDIGLVLSASLYALDDHVRAKAVMEEMLGFAEAEGFVGEFVRYAPIISPLLMDMAETMSNGRGSAHLVNIMKACGIGKKALTVQEQRRRLWNVHLTRREHEILQLMAIGYKNSEIADRTFVCLDTVKSHVKHIFEKLDVKTRVQAIRLAEAERILERPQETHRG
jgi:LuxR family maltose regulon positive regulatory protein